MSTLCRVVNIPGLPGSDGSSGIDGAQGANAFTAVTEAFAMPAIGSAVVVTVLDTSWMVPWSSGGLVMGQVLAVQFAGNLPVSDIVDSTHVEITNLGYVNNAAAGSVIPVGARVGVSGDQGIPGTTPGGALLAVNNLSDLTNLVTAWTNLGLGTAAAAALASLLQKASNLSDVANVATARSNLGLAIGTNIQAYSAFLAGLATAGPGAADQVPYLTAANTWAAFASSAAMRALLSSASNAALLVSLGRVMGRYGLLGSATAVNLNQGAAPYDATQTVAISATRYQVKAVLLESPSAGLANAHLGLFSGGGAAIPIVCADQDIHTALSGTSKFMEMALGTAAQTDVLTASPLVPRIGTPEGGAATVNLWVFGVDLS